MRRHGKGGKAVRAQRRKTLTRRNTPKAGRGRRFPGDIEASLRMSASGGKADMHFCTCKCLLLTQSGQALRPYSPRD